MFHFLAQSNQKEESDRLDFLALLVKRLPCAKILVEEKASFLWVGFFVPDDVSILSWHVCSANGHHYLWLVVRRISDLQESY